MFLQKSRILQSLGVFFSNSRTFPVFKEPWEPALWHCCQFHLVSFVNFSSISSVYIGKQLQENTVSSVRLSVLFRRFQYYRPTVIDETKLTNELYWFTFIVNRIYRPRPNNGLQTVTMFRYVLHMGHKIMGSLKGLAQAKIIK